MEKRISVIVFFICCSYSVFAQSFDINILKQVHTNRYQNLDGAMNAISDVSPYVMSSTPLLLYTIGAYKKDKKIQQQAINQGIGLAIVSASTLLAKRIANRDRPGLTYPQYIMPLQPKYYYSFPSGHTSMSFWWATSITMATKKWYYIAPAWTLASAVSYSRMHLGVHYPTDLIGGAVFGVTSAMLSEHINNWLQKNRNTKKLYNKCVWE
jgi:membrane-associated phospholipid phosphatase